MPIDLRTSRTLRRHLAGLAILLASASPAPVFGQTRETPAENVLKLSFADAVAIATTRSSAVRRAERSAEIAGIQVRNSKAGYYPALDVSVAANQSAAGSLIRSGDLAFQQRLTGNFIGGASINARVPLDISGIVGRQVKQARIGQDIAGLQLDQARGDAGANAAIAYLTALKARRAADTDRDLIASIDALIARAAKTAPGVAPFLTLELANARQSASLSAAMAETSEDSLRQALALPEDAKLDLVSELAAPAPDPSIDARLDPDSRADLGVAERMIDQADIAVVQSSDGRRPTVSGGVYYNQLFGGAFVSSAGESSTRNYGLSLNLSLPLLNYDAGRSDNSKRIAALRAAQARDDLDDRRRAAATEVRQARAAYDRARKRLDQLPDPEAAAAALKRAEDALLAAQPADAPALLAQVSNARNAWRAAKSATGDAWAEAAIATIRLRRALGLDAMDMTKR